MQKVTKVLYAVDQVLCEQTSRLSVSSRCNDTARRLEDSPRVLWVVWPVPADNVGILSFDVGILSFLLLASFLLARLADTRLLSVGGRPAQGLLALS